MQGEGTREDLLPCPPLPTHRVERCLDGGGGKAVLGEALEGGKDKGLNLATRGWA